MPESDQTNLVDDFPWASTKSHVWGPSVKEKKKISKFGRNVLKYSIVPFLYRS